MTENANQTAMEQEEQSAQVSEETIKNKRIKKLEKALTKVQLILQNILEQERSSEIYKKFHKHKSKKIGEKRKKRRSRSHSKSKSGNSNSSSSSGSSDSDSDVEFIACRYGGLGGYDHHYHPLHHCQGKHMNRRHGHGHGHSGGRHHHHDRRDHSHSRGRDRSRSGCRCRFRGHSRGHSRGRSRGHSATRDTAQQISSIGGTRWDRTSSTKTIEDRSPLSLTM